MIRWKSRTGKLINLYQTVLWEAWKIGASTRQEAFRQRALSAQHSATVLLSLQGQTTDLKQP